MTQTLGKLTSHIKYGKVSSKKLSPSTNTSTKNALARLSPAENIGNKNPKVMEQKPIVTKTKAKGIVQILAINPKGEMIEKWKLSNGHNIIHTMKGAHIHLIH